MLYGVDISNHQGGLKLSSLPSDVEFVICKATEGVGFVDKCCDKWVQDCMKLGIPWGFYHFAGKNNSQREARFFLDNCRNYFGHGIPVLDWEGDQSVKWVNNFVAKVHKETGIWPWIYANPWRFNQGGVEPNCARWIAQYPTSATSFAERPKNHDKVDGLVAAWQFTSTGRLKGWNGNLDLDVFYGDGSAWDKYAGIKTVKPTTPDNKPSTVTLENSEYRVDITPKK